MLMQGFQLKRIKKGQNGTRPWPPHNVYLYYSTTLADHGGTPLNKKVNRFFFSQSISCDVCLWLCLITCAIGRDPKPCGLENPICEGLYDLLGFEPAYYA